LLAGPQIVSKGTTAFVLANESVKRSEGGGRLCKSAVVRFREAREGRPGPGISSGISSTVSAEQVGDVFWEWHAGSSVQRMKKVLHVE
jgi:hypothetical protein